MSNQLKPITRVFCTLRDGSTIDLQFHMAHCEAIEIYDVFQWSRLEAQIASLDKRIAMYEQFRTY
jgi:hypothetical protein